jgi:hypothetical protein
VPSNLSVVATPGVEFVKNWSKGGDWMSGGRSPMNCGNGPPVVAPSLELVSVTSLAMIVPMFLTWYVTFTCVALTREMVEVVTNLTMPHGVVHPRVNVLVTVPRLVGPSLRFHVAVIEPPQTPDAVKLKSLVAEEPAPVGVRAP